MHCSWQFSPLTDFEPKATVTQATGVSSPPASLGALGLDGCNSPVSAEADTDGILIPFAAFSSTKRIPMSQASNPDKLTLPVGARDHSQGPMDATVTLVEYGGYQLCFVFRHFPQPQIHSQAQKAGETKENHG